MTVRANSTSKANKKQSKKTAEVKKVQQPSRLYRWFVRGFPGWVILAIVLVIIIPNAARSTFNVIHQTVNRVPASMPSLDTYIPISTGIAPLFTREVEYWAGDIVRWASVYGVDPALLATVMQIESCGHADVSSVAGAQGLFQVMPFHFDAGENQTDPETNARRGASYLAQCVGWANGDAGLALACYNGGYSKINQAFAYWPSETQRYYNWGTQIYADAKQNLTVSPALENWLEAGGSNLCTRAAANIGLSSQ